LASYSAKIDVIVGGLRELAALEGRLEAVQSIVTALKKTPVDLNVGGKGSGRDLSGKLSKSVNDIVRNFNDFGKSLTSVSKQAGLFGDLISQTALKSTGDFKKQDVAVKNLATAYTTAEIKARKFEEQQNNLVRTSKGLQTSIKREIELINRRAKVSRLREQKQRGINLRNDLALGAGFPLLFGGGPGAVLGGVGGAIAGGGKGGFGAQILGSALGAQVDAFVQGQTQIAASLQESTDVFAALESAGFKVAGSLKAVVQELEESGDAAGVYRIQQAELQKAYGANAVRDLSSFDAANQRLADSIKRITSGVLPPVLRVLTAMADISAGAINLFVDGVEAVRDAFRFIAGNEGATGDRARPDFRLEGGFAQATASQRSLVGLREEKALELEKERKKIIDQINSNQRKFSKEREQEANKRLQDERAFAKVKMDSLQLERRFANQLFQIDLERARLRGQALQQQGTADELRQQFEQRGRIAEFRAQQLRGFPGGALQAAESFQGIRAGEIDKVRKELQQLSTVMAVAGEDPDDTKERFQRLLTIFTELKQLEMDTEFKQIMDAMNAPFASLENEQELLMARLRGNEKEVQLKQAIANITKGMGVEDSARAENLIRGNAALEEQVLQAEKLKNLYRSVGSAIENGLVNGITSAIDGTKTLQESLAAILKDVGSILLQFAVRTGLNAINPTVFPMATGGYVSSPTNALIGEGGEPEYVIPESKMRTAMSRYSRGSRGDSVISGSGVTESTGEGGGGGTALAAPIDVRYTVERINSVDYVTADQFQTGMQQAAQQGAKQGEQQTLKRLQMSGSTRKRIGI